ncbi:MAG: hypothetical protein IH804_10575 [Planctomycetes bacterium]|nr:hypothetical protein [Planctomycetota bacterium]
MPPKVTGAPASVSLISTERTPPASSKVLSVKFAGVGGGGGGGAVTAMATEAVAVAPASSVTVRIAVKSPAAS